jgi:predicted transcriptional regulator
MSAAAARSRGTSHGPLTGVGPLEAEVLGRVWEHEPAPATVREVYEELLEQRPIAYTTVMSVLQNLTKKGFLACDRSKRTYRYRAARPAQQVRDEALQSVVDVLYRGRTQLAVGRLLGLEEELGPVELEALRAFARGLLEP